MPALGEERLGVDAGWSDHPHPGPNASLLVFKAGLHGSQPPCPNFLGVAAASSEDLTQPWHVITEPVKVIDAAKNHSEDAFLWRATSAKRTSCHADSDD